MWRDQTPITAEEIRELDSYCRERHIELIRRLQALDICVHCSLPKHMGSCVRWKIPERTIFFLTGCGIIQSMYLMAAPPSDQKMIAEYMQLFSSDKFNICADETFVLAKYKSKELAKECGIHRLYIDYVKELAQFLVENGKIPMFWGRYHMEFTGADEGTAWNHGLPELGYAPEQREDEKGQSHRQVQCSICVLVYGWNQWANLIENSL